MRVQLISDHTYPVEAGEGTGKKVSRWPSGAGAHIHDLLARGLAADGHQVAYLLLGGAAEPLPPGVELSRDLEPDVDVVHGVTCLSPEWLARIERCGRPWVMTCHIDPAVRGSVRSPPNDHWIFVSETLARRFGRRRFVHNGLDPSAYRYSAEGGDYLLFMSSLDSAEEKGLDVALRVAAKAGRRLLVAGSSRREEVIREVDERCRRAGATLLGELRGRRKAEVLAGAHALLFPSQVDESFGLVTVEALLSGTPVICSDRGACPEVISERVGILCRDEPDFVRAIGEVGAISRPDCRRWAVERYHYRAMARGYLTEYRRERAAWRRRQKSTEISRAPSARS